MNQQGITTNGITTRVAGAAIKRGQALKLDAAGKVVPCAAATDIPLFVAQWDAAAGQNAACGVLGSIPGTFLALVTAAVAAGDNIGVLGQVAATGAATVGKAIRAGAANDLVEFAHRVAVIL